MEIHYQLDAKRQVIMIAKGVVNFDLCDFEILDASTREKLPLSNFSPIELEFMEDAYILEYLSKETA